MLSPTPSFGRRAFTTRSGAVIDFTELGLGTAPLGNLYRPLDETTAQLTLEAAWSAGIRYYDTAPLYGLGLAETRLNHFLPNYNDAVVCTYDLSKFSAPVVMDITRTHPQVIVGGLLQENPVLSAGRH